MPYAPISATNFRLMQGFMDECFPVTDHPSRFASAQWEVFWDRMYADVPNGKKPAATTPVPPVGGRTFTVVRLKKRRSGSPEVT